MISDPVSAARALLVQYAQDTFTRLPRELAPPLDARMAPSWMLVGHLVAQDAILRQGAAAALGEDVCYGYVARNLLDSHALVAVVRGTGNLIEWGEDALATPVRHPIAGRVEAGFLGIYQSLRFVPLVGAIRPAALGIAGEMGLYDRVTVIGHSLGAAEASLLAFDLAPLVATNATLLASPQLGDYEFAKAFDARVGAKRYQLINRIVDFVPHVPFGPDYTHLWQCTWLWPRDEQIRVKFGPFCNHHVSTYAGVLHYATLQAANIAVVDRDNIACIKGANL